MPAAQTEAARTASLDFLKRVKVDAKANKVSKRLEVLRAEKYDAAEYAARLALAGKVDKILNRVAYAVREGRADPNNLDRKALQKIMVEGLSDYKADLTMRNLLGKVCKTSRQSDWCEA